jgi:hypothetical protein
MVSYYGVLQKASYDKLTMVLRVGMLSSKWVYIHVFTMKLRSY